MRFQDRIHRSSQRSGCPAALLPGALAVGLGLLVTGNVAAQRPFDDATAVWPMQNFEDATGQGSHLTPGGTVTVGVELQGQDREASLVRGGNGYAAHFSGGWLNAGQGEGGILNLTGDQMTMAIRLRDPSGNWNRSLFSKHGGHDRLVYNLFTANLGAGMALGFELGIQGRPGINQVRMLMAHVDAASWLDVIIRYTGAHLELFVNGERVDYMPLAGNLRTGNTEPVIIGGESHNQNVVRPFQGYVDYAALWSRALDDAEIAALSNVEALTEAPRYVETYRPQFHYTPGRNWMNDPNGLVYHNGKYHLFYQYNPSGSTWGNMSWGHAVSSDLLHWEERPVALPVSGGIARFSGSAVVDWYNTSGFGRNGEPPLVAVYTGHRNYDGRQFQELAYSNDDGRTWSFYTGNPVLDIGSNNFRDPKVIWHEASGRWIMAVALSVDRRIAFFGSPDLKEWTLLSAFGPEGMPGGIWECPDLFELPVDGDEQNRRWVLQVDVGDGAIAGGSGAFYFIGHFDGTQFHNDNPPGRVLWADFGKDFYATQSWSDIPEEDGRRIWLAWMSNWQYAQGVPTHPWRSAQTFPREVELRTVDDQVRLVQRPIREIERIRGAHHRFTSVDVDPGNTLLSDAGVRGKSLEIIAAFSLYSASNFGLKVRTGPDEETVIGYDAAREEMYVDRARSGAVNFSQHFPGRHAGPLSPVDSRIRLHILVDWSSVEVFGNQGETVITDLIFPGPESDGIELFAEGGRAWLQSLDIYEVESIWRGSETSTSFPGTVAVSPFESVRNYPNPFNPVTHIEFTLRRPGTVRIKIYDLLGRLVDTVLNQELLSGRHATSWDATDASGARVAGGVYLYRLYTEDGAYTGPMVLVR